MDEAAIEKEGLEPLKPELERIARLQSKAELPAYLAHAHGLGSNAFFEFSSQPDYKDASLEIAETDQSGLGLPDRDYYLRTDAKSVELRNRYVQHIQRMFVLAGDTPRNAAEKAKAVLAIETELAKASLDRVSRRDPARVYHFMSVDELAKLSPLFDWNRYFISAGAPKFDGLNVTVPDFVKGLNEVFAKAELNDIKTYLTWRLLSLAAPMLPKPFVDENFDFYGKTLTGSAGAEGALEALRAAHQRRSRGGPRPVLRSGEIPAGSQAARPARWCTPSKPAMHSDIARPFVDDRRNQEAGAGEAGGGAKQNRLSREVARLQRAEHRPRRCAGQCLARQPV